jgi:hypothetical protein
MSLITDRERRRYIQQIDDHIQACTDLRETLNAGDDGKALIARIKMVRDENFVDELRYLLRTIHRAAASRLPPAPW